MEQTNGNNTKIIVIAVIVVIAVAALMWWNGMQPTIPTASTTPTGESLSAIQNSAASVDTGNLDQEFQNINKDVNSL